MLKSDTTKENIKQKKLIKTKNNCKNVNEIILLSNTFELLNTVSLLKSETTKEKIKHKKLITTKNNCKNVNDNILVSNMFELLKYLYEK